MNIRSFFRIVIVVVLSLACVIGVLSTDTQSVQAQIPNLATFPAPIPLEGYAWSSNIGWISMSCENQGTCGTHDYRVTIKTDGFLEGYAWSSNIGWIKFGGMGSFPSGVGTLPQNAHVSGVKPNLKIAGWARACAGTQPGNCSTGASRTDGWDGWISLSGDSHAITLTNLVVQPSSFAWGSDVVGWIDFSNIILNSTPLIIDFKANPLELAWGDTTTLEWEVDYVTGCTASNDRAMSDWTGAQSHSGLANKVVTPALGTTVYTLTCTDSGGDTVSQSVTVNSLPDIILTAFSPATIGSPDAYGIYPAVYFNAAIDGLPANTPVSYTLDFATSSLSGDVTKSAGGVLTFDPPLQFSNVVFGVYSATIRVDLPQPGAVGENRAATVDNEDIVGNSRTINIVDLPPPPPEMSFTGKEFVRVNEIVELEWSVSAPYALSCTVSGSGVNESFVTSGVPLDASAGSAFTPELTSFIEYVLRCTSAYGDHNLTTTIEVIPDFEEV